MKPITNISEVNHYRGLVRELIASGEGPEYELDDHWVRTYGWKVVPVESAARLPKEDIPRIVSSLNNAGYFECFAIIIEAGYTKNVDKQNERIGDVPTCYTLSANVPDFQELNRKWGPFRFLMTQENRSWAISCNESYNLFAAKPELLVNMLGKPIEQARREFFELASILAADKADYPLVQIAKRYAAL